MTIGKLYLCETVLTSRLNWPINFNEASSQVVIIDFSTNKLGSENDTTHAYFYKSHYLKKTSDFKENSCILLQLIK